MEMVVAALDSTAIAILGHKRLSIILNLFGVEF
jgi:hypothetical protein